MMNGIYKEFANDRVKFGRYKGTKLKDVPMSYLKWFIAKATDRYWAEVFALELCRRDKSFR
jgi:uncharacterized protein (DUF3820 family)